MKKSYLVVYDYGMGGVWAVINARSKAEIASKFPKLTVCETRPAWMTDDKYEKIRTARELDIDDEPYGWFLSLRH